MAKRTFIASVVSSGFSQFLRIEVRKWGCDCQIYLKIQQWQQYVGGEEEKTLQEKCGVVVPINNQAHVVVYTQFKKKIMENMTAEEYKYVTDFWKRWGKDCLNMFFFFLKQQRDPDSGRVI